MACALESWDQPFSNGFRFLEYDFVATTLNRFVEYHTWQDRLHYAH